MTFQPQHTGLYFSAEHIEQARQGRGRNPLKSAWAFLDEYAAPDNLSALIADGLRYRFNDNAAAGQQAVNALQELNPPEMPYRDDVLATVALAQGFEMARSHPAFSDTAQRDWQMEFSARVERLNRTLPEGQFVEGLLLGLLNTAAGIVLGNADTFQRGVAVYRQAVEKDITPDGYMPRAVQNASGESYLRQMLALKALVLTAEAATLAGENLWAYAVRGVSVTTAAVYLNYYYYFPDKWRWDNGAAPDAAGLFRQHGGYLEILNRRIHPKDIQTLLYDLRPLFDVTGGGLTTLTHGASERRGLFG